jgi:hypothetical protein
MRVGAKVTTFRPGDVKVGYYYIAPGKKPRIEYGVATDLAIQRFQEPARWLIKPKEVRQTEAGGLSFCLHPNTPTIAN